MPEYVYPGVYVEEVPTSPQPIQGVSTSAAGFVGASVRAPISGPIKSYADFNRVAGPNPSEYLCLALRGFFDNGGQLCYVARIAATDPLEEGLDALANEKVSIVCCPDENKFKYAASVMATHCEKRKDRMCILQSPQPVMPDSAHQVPVRSSYGAYYYPWISVIGLDGATSVTIPPGGHIAGVLASTETNKGVWVSPASVPVVGVSALSHDINAAESDILNSSGINVLRIFPGRGILVWGARTTSEDPAWQYVNVRRLLIFVEQSLTQGLQWAVFEPNGPALWTGVRATIENFLSRLWRLGALTGQTPEEAYFVRCDQTTMSQADIDLGRVVVIVGVAAVRGSEYIILRVTCQTKSTASAAS